MRPIARLVLRSGGGGILFLRAGQFVVGRGSACDLVLDAPGVSRRHAVVEVDESAATVSDQGSRNGTRVDGVAADRCPLAHGSVLEIGPVTCVFEWLDQAHCGDNQPTPATEAAGPVTDPPLTAAEQRILNCLLCGLAEKQIASKLNLSPHTVHNHVRKIYFAYRVNSRPELLARFIG